MSTDAPVDAAAGVGSDADDPAIRIEHVRKHFAGTSAPAVADLSLDVPRGEVVMLVGPSGCGKTTTLKMVNRLVEPSGGRIEVEGTDVLSTPAPELRRSIGYVIQQVGLFPHRTIAQNIATVPELLGWDTDRRAARVRELLELMHLDDGLAERYPSELSGGQRQRVGVARALAADPPVLLMDEPFGAVDPLVRGNLQQLLLDLQAEQPRTILFVTHDIDEAILLGDRIAILNVGGVLEQYDTPARILAEPANEFVRAFLGSERGLRRLALQPVEGLELDAGPTVTPDTTADEAHRTMRAAGRDWVVVVEDDGRLRGWVGRDALAGARRVGDVPAQDFLVSIDAGASLREAIDAIVSTRHNVAVVCRGDRYAGLLDVAAVSRGLVA